ncbi:MAG: polysaccharide deacetylase family protein [Bradymonadaceae bacterium]
MREEFPGSAPVAAISVDLDTLRFYRDIHGLPQRRRRGEDDPAYVVGVRRLLDLFEACGIRATLFVIGRDLESPGHCELLNEATTAGHELANHTHSHFYDLRRRHFVDQREEIVRCEEAIAKIWGRAPVGFRAPGYNIAEDLLEVCLERGYTYDASIFPCPPYYIAKAAVMAWLKLTRRPSRSSMTPVHNLCAPLAPYRPRLPQYWTSSARGSGLWEIPVAVVPYLRFPLIGTSLHLLGPGGFDALFGSLRRAYPDLFNLEFHAIDFMDATDPGVEDLVSIQPDLAIPWEQKRRLYTHIFQRLRQTYRFAPMCEAVDGLG